MVATHTDGSRIFQSEEDLRRQREVASLLEPVWNCQIRWFGEMCVVDWYALKDERMSGVIELKCKLYPHDKYEADWFSVKKWANLVNAAWGLNTVGWYVAAFSDHIYGLPVQEIDARNVVLGGWANPRRWLDREPMIAIQMSNMRLLCRKSWSSSSNNLELSVPELSPR